MPVVNAGGSAGASVGDRDPTTPRNPLARFRESVLKRYWKTTRGNNVALIHAGRCGSTVLCSLLGQSRRVRVAGDVFNPDDERRMRLLGELGAPGRFLRHEMRGVGEKWFLFATKPFREETQEPFASDVAGYLSQLRGAGVCRFIVLQRRNYVRRRVSGLVAFKTKIWHSQVSPDRPRTVRFPENELHHLAARIAAYDREHRIIRSLLPDRHRLDLYYEDDVEADPRVAYRKTCRFLRLLAFEPRIDLARTNPFLLRDLLENYDDVGAALRGTPHEWMLEA